MVATFYLLAESFRHNAAFSREEIELKTNALAADFVQIKKYKDTNELWIHPEIYDVVFIDKITITDLLFKEEIAGQHLDRDARVSLQRIIVESPELTDYTAEKVITELLPEHDENTCHGLIAFNAVANIQPELQVVYDINGWYKFRRYFLGIYPKEEKYFIDECKKYYPALFFHERNKGTVGHILKSASGKIVHYLSELNDKYNNCRTTPYSRQDTLKRFNISCSFDQNASPEGNIKRKKDLTWPFTTDKGKTENVYCELHLKLLKDDTGKVSTDRRIYFHEGKENIEKGKILVGHIGDHL